MSGTSLDGVDAALVRISDEPGLDLVAFRTASYDDAFRDRLLRAIRKGDARELALLDVALGERFADAAEGLLSTTEVGRNELEFVASHGQTVWHEPGRATLQLGDPAVVAERLGVTVVSDFRSRDVAAGGQGAPLVPIADVDLFGRSDGPRILLNVGGMANLTRVARRGDPESVLAFDTGPGMAVIDAVVRRLVPDLTYDEDGRLAARGAAATEVVEALLGHAFFRAPPPRSTGREAFGERFAEELIARMRSSAPAVTVEDVVATAVELTARSVALSIDRWLPPEDDVDLLVSGGGARNATLIEGLRSAVRGTPVRRFEEDFFDGDAKEAAAFAYLGLLAVLGEPGNVPAATGAAGPRILGRITPA
jgi:anhydro-N-acetylmuramic acid kinase